MKKKFKIDFFEFAFLVEACITPRPIARSMFFQEVSDKYYHEMTNNERERLYTWIKRTYSFERGIEEKDKGCLLFEARFNPYNQYKVFTKYEGKEEVYKCFKHNDRYHLTKQRSINEDYISKVEKI